jgi:hypothetical protein
MKHYSYFGGKVYGEPVERYYILEAYTLPPSFKLNTFENSQEALELWYQATVPMWEYMTAVENGTAKPWMAAVHEDRYGPCEMQKACFTYRLDESLMENDYLRVERDGV